MSEAIIELVQLENGDIALRNSDDPDQPLVTISISKQVQNLLPGDKIDIANAMIEAGIERYQEIQFQRMEEEQTDLEVARSAGLLH